MYPLQYFYENGIIPLKFRGLIPEECDCGGHFVLNLNMTQLSCSNPTCPYHMAQRMDSMLKQLNVKDIGPSKCLAMIEENGLVHHTQVFRLGVDQMPSVNQLTVRERYYDEIQKVKSLTLASIAKLLRAPDMQTRCEDIFKGYNDIDTFYTDFNYDENFIARQLGMSKGILTGRFTQHLIQYESILRGLCQHFQIINVASESLVICMTGDVVTARREDGTYYKSREVFLKEMQDLTQGIVNIVKKTSVSDKIHYLITDTPDSGTSKNRRADELGKPKLTFAEFKDYLTKYVQLEGGN